MPDVSLAGKRAPVRKILLSRDPEQLVLIAEDLHLHSPSLWAPFHGSSLYSA